MSDSDEEYYEEYDGAEDSPVESESAVKYGRAVELYEKVIQDVLEEARPILEEEGHSNLFTNFAQMWRQQTRLYLETRDRGAPVGVGKAESVEEPPVKRQKLEPVKKENGIADDGSDLGSDLDDDTEFKMERDAAKYPSTCVCLYSNQGDEKKKNKLTFALKGGVLIPENGVEIPFSKGEARFTPVKVRF